MTTPQDTPPDPGVVPSNIGGAHWGGVAADNQSGIVVVPVNRIAAVVQLIPSKGFDVAAATRLPSAAGVGCVATCRICRLADIADRKGQIRSK